jgi:hypothetical protein
MARKNLNSVRNPRNAENSLFKKLTKLFSGPIVNYDRQTPRKLRRRDLDIYNKRFKSASGQPFRKSAFNPYAKLSAHYFSNQNRAERYVDFDQMEYAPIIHTALDIYADEITTSTDIRKLLSIKCPNQEVKTILQTLYHNVMNLEHNLYGWARTTCKYGDYFLYLDIDENIGIKHVIGLPALEIERMEGEDPNNPDYIQYQWNSAGVTLENWQVAHFRILGNDKYAPYGTSILEPARRVWRQLDLLENAMMAYRIVRSPERRVFYIDIGHIEPQDVEQYVLEMQTRLKKNLIADDASGRVDIRYNPLNLEEDYFIPVRGKDRGTKIDTLQGGSYTGDIDDVKYLREKLVTAIKIPYNYLISGEGDSAQSSLAQKDIRFARTITRLQKSIISELAKIGQIHLFTLGYRGEDLTSFKLSLNNPSQLAELQELEALRTRFEVAASANEGMWSRRYIYEHIFGLTKEEIRRIEIEKFSDKKMDALLDAVAEEVMAEAGSGIGDLDGELAGLEGEDDEMAGLAGTAGEVGAEGPEGGALMAAPGKRDMTTTPRSKGKMYKPVAADSRGMGARRRNYFSKGGGMAASSSDTTVNKGMKKLRSIGRGIYESIDEKERLYLETLDEQLALFGENDQNSDNFESTYNEREMALFENIDDIKGLSILLEKEFVKPRKEVENEVETQ